MLSFTSLLSSAERLARVSAFGVPNDVVEQLSHCEAFQSIRSLLANRLPHGFCELHEHEQKDIWLLQRDITFALVQPLLEIHQRATHLATVILEHNKIWDLELAFSGQARGAFAWLQCFIAEEEDWVLATGCPACAVTYVLQAEPNIRVILTACRLSQSMRRENEALAKLPILDYWLFTLHKAIEEDDFWEPDFLKNVELRARRLETGIYEMAYQCRGLEKLADQKPAITGCRNDMWTATESSERILRQGTCQLARRTANVTSDEGQWMQILVRGSGRLSSPIPQ